MNYISVNALGTIRKQVLNGQKYIIAPMSMLVPGVLNGSKGALMYPIEEVQKNPGVWNNVPITIGHPYGKNNEAVSARDPEVLNKFQIGAVFNDRFENGKRVAEGWFDEELTKNKAPEVYAALNAGTPMEVSTGLFTDDEPAQNGANHGGVAYQFIAKNYRPDHLAVLPNQRGACSLSDGCGLNTNSQVIKLTADDELGQKLEEINGLLTKIVNTNAAPNQPKSQNTGKFKAMNAGTGKGETHQSAQDGWHGGPRPQECGCPPGVACNCDAKMKSNSKHKRGPKMNREQGVQWLVTNCDCHKGKDRVLANADNYSDAEILALVENEQRAQTNQLVVNKFIEAVPGVQSIKLNEIPAFVKGKMKADGEEETDEAPETTDEEMTEEEKPVGNAKKSMTAEQYIAAMPESLRPVWNEMVANSESQRAELVAEVNKIVKNERDPQRRAIVENKLKGKLTNGELKELIALIKPTANSTRREPAPAPSPAPSYFGMQGGPAAQVNNATLPADELVLDIPTINFADMASPSYKKR